MSFFNYSYLPSSVTFLFARPPCRYASPYRTPIARHKNIPHRHKAHAGFFSPQYLVDLPLYFHRIIAGVPKPLLPLLPVAPLPVNDLPGDGIKPRRLLRPAPGVP